MTMTSNTLIILFPLEGEKLESDYDIDRVGLYYMFDHLGHTCTDILPPFILLYKIQNTGVVKTFQIHLRC